jgi:hypothetical protein
MIWFQQNVPRNDIHAEIIGRWNSGDQTKNLVEIILVINGEERILYTHNPSGNYHEPPDSDDILYKYNSKIRKLMQKAKEYSLEHFLLWKK